MNADVFIKWTNSLIDYFFSRDSEEEVFLYVDEQILDQIGAEVGLGNHQSFLNTVLVSEDNRNCLYNELFHYVYGVFPENNSSHKSSSILQFAKLLKYGIQKAEFYFPYAVLVMYYASKTINNNNQAIGRYLKEQLNITNYNPIVDLFDWVHNEHTEFKNKRKTKQRIVGLIKYQLLLSPSEIKEINEGLYRISYEDNYSLSYVDKIRLIKDSVNDHVKYILRESLSNPDYQHRINSIIDMFDLESYERVHHNNICSILFRKEFALFLDFSQGRHFRLLSNYRPKGKKDLLQGDTHFTFTPSIDSIDIYNSEFVECNGNFIVELKEYYLRTTQLEIKPIPLGDVVFFYKYNEQKYLQSRNAYNRKVYIFVKKDRNGRILDEWENWADQNAFNCRRVDETNDVSDLTQGVWALYLADGLNAPYYTREDGWNITNNVKTISKRGGILVGKNTYLINALPFFEFPYNIQEEGLSVTINGEDRELSRDVDYRYFIQGNKLIIDLINDSDYKESRKIEVCINYSPPKTSEQLSAASEFWDNPCFYVRGQNIIYDQQKLYIFDKWGEKIDVEKEDADNRIIQGNFISGIRKTRLSNDRHFIESNDYNTIPNDNFYFLNLLASCIYMDPTCQITRDRLNKCIKYAATRLNIGVNEDGFVTRVISLLINSGYIAADFETSHYQAIPPAFIKIPRSIHNGGNQIWMLTGAYTRRFFNELVNYCTNNKINIKLRYSKKLENSNGSLKLLPPIILVGHNFNPQSFIGGYPYHCFDVNDTYDQALDLLSLLPSITEYKSTLERVPRDRVDVTMFVRPESNEFPRIREDNPYGYNNHVYIEQSYDGDFLKPSITEKWNHLYCYYKRNTPFIIKGTQHIYLPEDLRLPSLINRSLFIMNVGVPKYQKAFICGRPSKKIYTRMKSYKVNDARLHSVFEKLTGNSNYIDNPHIREKVISSKNNREGNWTYHMALWSKKADEELNDKIPNKLLVLQYKDIRYNTSDIVAISTYKKEGHIIKTYVNVQNKNSFLEVNSDSNDIMSFIIQNPKWQYKQIPFADNPSEIALSIFDHYVIEDDNILIL